MSDHAAYGNGFAARLARAERDIEKLDDEKADADDVARLAKAFDDLRHTLLWFIGIMVGAVFSFAGLVIVILGHG